jgi:hypothetical protein
MTDPVDAMLAEPRGFTIAAAGCGKTQLIGRITADERSGRQLILTHTHAGVAAIRARLARMRVPSSKFHLDTIAAWCLRYAASYPGISGFDGSEATPDWQTVYPCVLAVLQSALGRRVVRASYDGVLIDEYQDCSVAQHAVVEALAAILPCRGVGDPLQSVFGFRDDPCVTTATIEADFTLVPPLRRPWRWERAGHNRELGAWLVNARDELESTGTLKIGRDDPVTWIKFEGEETWAAACREAGAPSESTIAITNWRNQSINLARRLGGRWPVVERFDDPDVFTCADAVASGNGAAAVLALFDFLAPRVTKLGTELRPIVQAIAKGPKTLRFRKHLDHIERFVALRDGPSPETVLAALEGLLAHKDWWLYRRGCVQQLRAALRACAGGTVVELPAALAVARVRARHRGRPTHRRTVGTPLLVKGLEFDHAVVLWDPQPMSIEGLYVAITRGSRSLTVVSRSRTLSPAGA